MDILILLLLGLMLTFALSRGTKSRVHGEADRLVERQRMRDERRR